MAGFACCLHRFMSCSSQLRSSWAVFFAPRLFFPTRIWPTTNRKVVTFTIRRAPRGNQKKRGDSWFFLGKQGHSGVLLQSAGGPSVQLACSCECFSNSLELAFGSSGVFLFAACVLFLLSFVFSCWPRLAGPCWASALQAGLAWSGTDVVALSSRGLWSGGSPLASLWLAAAAAASIQCAAGRYCCEPCWPLFWLGRVSALCIQSLSLVVY